MSAPTRHCERQRSNPDEGYKSLGHKLIKGIERSRYRGVISKFC
jgi:hypothetical protein